MGKAKIIKIKIGKKSNPKNKITLIKQTFTTPKSKGKIIKVEKSK